MSPSPAVFGQPVTLTFDLKPGCLPNCSDLALPTGTADFKFSSGSGIFGSATVSNGQAVLSYASFPVGTFGIQGFYNGDANWLSHGSNVTVTINKASTTTALVAAPASSLPGQSVTLTATVTPAAATGTVTFLDSGTNLGSAQLNGGSAGISVSSLQNGSHSLTASYSGDSNYTGSVSPSVTESVSPAPATSITLTATPNPATTGQTVTLSATVTPTNATGTVTFFDGAIQIGSGALSGGTASFATNSLAAGNHSLTASYNGSTSYAGSTSPVFTESVTGASNSTTTALTASPNPAAVGQNVALTATVTPAAASGTVTFFDGANQIGTNSLTNGTAAFATSALTAGSHSLTASYGGNSSYSQSTSPAFTETVGQSTTLTPVSVAPAYGTGNNRTFTFQFSAVGYQSLGVVNVLINNFLDGRHACYLAYVVATSTLVLVDDGGDAGSPYAGSLALGNSSSIQNSQCAVGLDTAVGSGNTLTLVLTVTFQPAFGGNKIAYLAARDQGTGNSGWQALGVWQVPFTAGTISMAGVTPARATGAAGTSQQYTIVVTDTKGGSDLGVVNVLVNNFIDGHQACYLAYVAATNTLLLVDDAGDAAGPYAPLALNGGTGNVHNSQCSINGATSSATTAGTTLVLTLDITFTAAFTGNRVVYTAARDGAGGNNTDWQALATRTVQ
jgi:hypothetical protein